MMDIALPKDNEDEFISIAPRLGINKLLFLYPFDKFQNKKSKIFDFDFDFDFNVEIGCIASHKNINEASKHSGFLAVKSSDKDRFFIESKKVRMIYGLEESYARDYLHQRKSGLNHIMCELARKNGVTIGFSYGSLLEKDTAASSLLMGRMMQNIALCQKYNVRTMIGSFSENPFGMRAPHDVKSLFALMGMRSGKTQFLQN